MDIWVTSSLCYYDKTAMDTYLTFDGPEHSFILGMEFSGVELFSYWPYVHIT